MAANSSTIPAPRRSGSRTLSPLPPPVRGAPLGVEPMPGCSAVPGPAVAGTEPALPPGAVALGPGNRAPPVLVLVAPPVAAPPVLVLAAPPAPPDPGCGDGGLPAWDDGPRVAAPVAALAGDDAGWVAGRDGDAGWVAGRDGEAGWVPGRVEAPGPVAPFRPPVPLATQYTSGTRSRSSTTIPATATRLRVEARRAWAGVNGRDIASSLRSRVRPSRPHRALNDLRIPGP
jgi:hypothetical protein